MWLHFVVTNINSLKAETKTAIRVFHGRTEFACMEMLAKIVDFLFAKVFLDVLYFVLKILNSELW